MKYFTTFLTAFFVYAGYIFATDVSAEQKKIAAMASHNSNSRPIIVCSSLERVFEYLSKNTFEKQSMVNNRSGCYRIPERNWQPSKVVQGMHYGHVVLSSNEIVKNLIRVD